MNATTRRTMFIVISCVVIWGIFALLWCFSGPSVSSIVVVVCAVFGWQALNRIQPAMFLWMSWIGWIIYFLIKFVLAAIVGLFVAPIKIGKWVGDKIADQEDAKEE